MLESAVRCHSDACHRRSKRPIVAANLSGKVDSAAPQRVCPLLSVLFRESETAMASDDLFLTPLNALHLELGARMVPFAGYSMPVQYAGLMAEHQHTRTAASLFDVSHMGQLRLSGPDAAAAFESLMPVDVQGLGVNKQRYGLLLNEAGGILDDLMFVNTGEDLFVIVNGACKVNDLAHMQATIGTR